MKFAIGHLLEVVWFARVPVLKSERFPRGHPEKPATYFILMMVVVMMVMVVMLPHGHPEEPATI